jgi:hypothetical protein
MEEGRLVGLRLKKVTIIKIMGMINQRGKVTLQGRSQLNVCQTESVQLTKTKRDQEVKVAEDPTDKVEVNIITTTEVSWFYLNCLDRGNGQRSM